MDTEAMREEYRELQTLVSVLGNDEAQHAADDYLLNKFLREEQGQTT